MTISLPQEKSGILFEPLLIGRDLEELEQLKRYLSLAVEGKGQIVFILGEAGSGKTKLVNEFLNLAQKKENIITMAGWCLSDIG